MFSFSRKAIASAPGLALALMTFALPARAAAPEPTQPVDPQKLYAGHWLEIARVPMSITKGCVAGATDYVMTGPVKVEVTDSCHSGDPSGKLRTIKGHGEILDPATHAKLRVHYPLFITWDYWILAHGDDYGWFIAADPAFTRLFIFTRTPPTGPERASLIDKARSLGFDVGKLEFPAQPAG
jgi:apolipoprotein D and lipocalin family protein